LDSKDLKEKLVLQELKDSKDHKVKKENKELWDLLDLPDLKQPRLSLIFANFISSQVTIAIVCRAEIRPWSLVVEAIAEPMV